MMIFCHILSSNNQPLVGSCLLAKQIYAVVCTDSEYSTVLIWNTLLSSSRAGHPSYLLTRDIQTGDTQIQDAIRCGAIQVLLHNLNSSPAKVSQQLQRELSYFAVPDKSLILIDHAEDIFTDLSHTERSLNINLWRKWAQDRECAVLFLFRPHHTQSNWMSLMAKHASDFAGLACLQATQQRYRWDIFHWFSANSISAGRSIQLALENGQLITTEQTVTRVTFEPSSDQYDVFVLANAIPHPHVIPESWHIIEHLDALFEQAKLASAATFVLTYDTTSDFYVLAKEIFLLRKQCSERIKIVLRETNTKLRYNQLALLLKFGVNLIVPQEVSYSRFLNFNSMLQGQLFSYDLPDNFDSAMHAIMPEQQKGYLPVPLFIQTIAQELNRNIDCPVQSVLIQLVLAQGLTPLDALEHLAIKRIGDICSADEHSIYLFLFACQEVDIEITVQRLFLLPPSSLFSSEYRLLSPLTIQTALTELATRKAIPDLSTALKKQAATPATCNAETIPYHPAPARAVSCPLSLRATT